MLHCRPFDEKGGTVMTRVMVVGTGIMSSGMVAGFLAHGAEVVLAGRSRDSLAQCAAQSLEFAEGLAAAQPGAVPPAGPNPARSSTTLERRLITTLLDDWRDWDDVDLALETITENLELKQQLFARLDHHLPPDVPIGSNSSGIPISKIAASLPGAARMFGTHYFMPAHIVPLVEVVLGEHSDPALGQRVCDLFAVHGKKPVLVKKDIPGFLANRIQHALMREALSLIDAGIASPEDVDMAVRYSFGFRYAAIGPIMQKEISGWDTNLNASREIYPSLSNSPDAPRCVADLVSQGRLGMKSGRGFFEWTTQTADAERRAYEARLKAAFELLK